MYLRKLKIKDASLMLEWMHDKDVVAHLNNRFSGKSIDDCISFIKNSWSDRDNIHLAISSENDEYMGTVSLKRINRVLKCAEFGITVRKKAMGKGYSWFAMINILHKAFTAYRLDSVVWCVSSNNSRACRFYDKHHFSKMNDVPEWALEPYRNMDDLIWYIATKKDNNWNHKKDEILGCKIVNLKTIGTQKAGQLTFFEGMNDIDFEIKRIYYITNAEEGTKRGFHAHIFLKQLIFCPYGEINFIVDNGSQREEILLNSPSEGIIIDKPIWREMIWIKSNSVLCVAASDYYDEKDYIRNYEDFLSYLKSPKQEKMKHD